MPAALRRWAIAPASEPFKAVSFPARSQPPPPQVVQENFVRRSQRVIVPQASSTQNAPAGQVFDFVVGPTDSTIRVASSTLLRWRLRSGLISIAVGNRTAVAIESARAELQIAGVSVDASPIITSGITALAHGQEFATDFREDQFEDVRAISQPTGAAPNWQLLITLELNNTAAGAIAVTLQNILWELEFFELTQTTYPQLRNTP